jgi:hypothetical protein
MNVKIDGVVHTVFALPCDNTGADHYIYCPWEHPCAYHTRKLIWCIETFCGIQFEVKGRPKKAKSTCLMCLASSGEG